MAKWTKAEVPGVSAFGTKKRPGWVSSAVPGLGVARDSYEREWAIYHLGSGCTVIHSFKHQQTARAAALDLGDLGNWDRTAEDIVAEPEMKSHRDHVRKIRGGEVYGPKRRIVSGNIVVPG